LKIKSVTGVLSRVFTDPRARFFGNVAIGRAAGHIGATVDVAQLRAAYDAVLVATGAPHARRLGLPGEDLPGSYAAGDLVSWYDGQPRAGVPYTTAADSVAVVGAGNVSLDIVRVLLKGGAGLAHTDAPVDVLDRLDRHPPREIHVIARRGPADVKFAQAELLELEKLSDVDVDVSVHPDDLWLDPADAARCAGDRTVAARVDTFRRWAAAPRRPGARRVHLRFRRGDRVGPHQVPALRGGQHPARRQAR
jgi:ferredoxin--NADP+ reductase